MTRALSRGPRRGRIDARRGGRIGGLVLWAALTPLAALLGFVAVARDLGRRFVPGIRRPGAAVRADAVARDLAAAYADMADRLPDPAFVIDRQGRVRSQNGVARKISGASRPGSRLPSFYARPNWARRSSRRSTRARRPASTYVERVPAERWFAARVAALGDGASAHFVLVLTARPDRGRSASSGCAPTSSPMPATSCARRSPR